MSAEIIDIRTRRPWVAPGQAEVLPPRRDSAVRADCTADFYDLIFIDPEDDDWSDAPPWAQPRG